MSKLKVLMLSDPLFRPSGYGNTNLSQLPYLSQIFDMSYIAWGWNGMDPSYHELAKVFPGVEFYHVAGEHHGRDILHAVIAKAKPDIIILHGDIYMFSNTMQEELAKYRGKICILALYPIDGENIPTSWIPFMERLDGLICLTEFGKKETNKVVSAPVKVAPLGVDTNLFKPITPDEKRKLRQEKFPFMNNKFVVTWVGRNFSRKNPGLAVAGFAKWVKQKKIKDAILYMHCADNDPAGNSIIDLVQCHYPHVENMVTLPSNFNIGTGINRGIFAQVLQCSDVGLNTSLGEGWGMPITETMACGVPVIVPAHSACMEQVGKNAERGELIKIAASIYASANILQHIGDPNSLVDKLDLLYSDKNRWMRKARAGYEWAKNMTWNHSCNELIKAIDYFYGNFKNGIPRSMIEII